MTSENAPMKIHIISNGVDLDACIIQPDGVIQFFDGLSEEELLHVQNVLRGYGISDEQMKRGKL